MGNYSVDVISSLTGLGLVEQDWERLCRSAEQPNVFLTYAWYRAWSERLSHDIPAIHPHAIVLRCQGRVEGICPLIHWKHSRLGVTFRKIEFAGVHADYNGFLLGADSAAQAKDIFAHLAKSADEWDVVDLRELPEESIALLVQALDDSGLQHQCFTEPETCPYLPIAPTDFDPAKLLGGDQRRELRRRMNRAIKAGCRVRIIEEPHNEPGLLEKIVDLDWQKHLRRSSPAFVGLYPDVFRSLFQTLGPRGWLYVALMEQGDRPVAFQLGFRCGRKLWDYTKAFDPAFASLAPGTLLLPPLLEYASTHGYDEYDFLRGDEPYKLQWCTRRRCRFRILAWNRTWRSRSRKWLFRDLKAMLSRAPQ